MNEKEKYTVIVSAGLTGFISHVKIGERRAQVSLA